MKKARTSSSKGGLEKLDLNRRLFFPGRGFAKDNQENVSMSFPTLFLRSIVKLANRLRKRQDKQQ